MLNILNHQILKSRVVGWKYRSVIFEHFIDILLDSGQTLSIFICGGDMLRQNYDKELAQKEYVRLDKYLRDEVGVTE